jgi:hypothetical protein
VCGFLHASLSPRLGLAVQPSPLRADPIYLKPQSVGDIKVGGYSMCKGFPCKVRARLAALAASVAPPLYAARVGVGGRQSRHAGPRPSSSPLAPADSRLQHGQDGQAWLRQGHVLRH